MLPLPLLPLPELFSQPLSELFLQLLCPCFDDGHDFEFDRDF